MIHLHWKAEFSQQCLCSPAFRRSRGLRSLYHPQVRPIRKRMTSALRLSILSFFLNCAGLDLLLPTTQLNAPQRTARAVISEISDSTRLSQMQEVLIWMDPILESKGFCSGRLGVFSSASYARCVESTRLARHSAAVTRRRSMYVETKRNDVLSLWKITVCELSQLSLF